MADYDIFREQLAIKYPSYGHALWEPSPWKPDRPVQVGDVGFIRNGRFHSLFNALRPAEGQSNVPEHYEQLSPKFSDHISNSSLSSNHYCSPGISVEPEPDFHASSPDDFRQVSFRHPRRRGGAVLSLPVKARREDTLAKGDFGAWIVKHIDRWFAFARGLGLGIEQMEEIILVTGCDHSRSWTNVAFLGSEYNAQATFGFKVDHGRAVNIEWQSSPEHVQGAVLHRGPDGTNLPEDQCIFIRGFRVARTFRIFPKQLKAAAGPSPDLDDYNFEPDIEVVSIPAIAMYRDPLHTLLDYIAERAPDCDRLLIHDDDLISINGLNDGSSLETLQPDELMDLLWRSNIDIHAVYSDLSHNSSNPKSSTKMVRVAMFSVQNWAEIAPQTHPSSVTTSSNLLHAIESPALPSQNLPDRLPHLEGTPVPAAPSAHSMVRAARLPSPPPGGLPTRNDKGQCICRQCGQPGRYKEGKCVEKWGPGPQGPGTVCNRCRKKMKRVERRGTLYPHSKPLASVDSRSHAPVQVRDYMHGADRSIGHTDPSDASHPQLPQQPPQGYGGPSEARKRDAVRLADKSSSDSLVTLMTKEPENTTSWASGVFEETPPGPRRRKNIKGYFISSHEERSGESDYYLSEGETEETKARGPWEPSISSDEYPTAPPPTYTSTVSATYVNDNVSVVSGASFASSAFDTLTYHRKLREARIDSDFDRIIGRLISEWYYTGASLFSIAAFNTTVFGFTPGTLVNVDNFAKSSLIISTVAAAVGLVVDVWFIFAYSGADVRKFQTIAVDIYGSYFFFSLSSRLPLVALTIAVLALVCFLCAIAWTAWPSAVLVMCVITGVLVSLQFIVYGIHRLALGLAWMLRGAWRRGNSSSVTVTRSKGDAASALKGDETRQRQDGAGREQGVADKTDETRPLRYTRGMKRVRTIRR